MQQWKNRKEPKEKRIIKVDDRCRKIAATKLAKKFGFAEAKLNEITRPTGDGEFPGCELTHEEIAFANAMHAYQVRHNKKFPKYSEILAVLHSLGYRKIAESLPSTQHEEV